MRIILIIIIYLFLCLSGIFAQTDSIQITNVPFAEKQTGVPIAGIIIYADPESREVLYFQSTYSRQFFQSDCDVLLFLVENTKTFCSPEEIDRYQRVKELLKENLTPDTDKELPKKE